MSTSIWSKKLFLTVPHSVYATNDEVDAEVYISGLGRRGTWADVVSASNLMDAPKSETLALGDGSFEISMNMSAFDHDHFVMFPDSPRAWGYVFHCACWEMLSHFSSVEETTRLRSLMSLCRSFPIQHGIINWGHDYHGSVHCDNDIAPGGEPELRHRAPGSSLQEADPLDIISIHQGFRVTNNGIWSPALDATPHVVWASRAATARDDIFARLPMEISHRLSSAYPRTISPD